MPTLQTTTFFKDKKILVIDDSQMILSATRAMLIKNGCISSHVILVKDAKSAVLESKNHKFDFILCDYNLGKGTDGLQLIEQLKSERLLCDKAIVFIVTGEMSKSVFYGFAEYEPDGYLIKPVNINEVTPRLISAYRQKKAINEIHKTYLSGGVKEAFALCDKYGTSMNIAYAKAEILIKEARYDDAQKIYVSLINKQNSLARIHLANMLIDREKYDMVLKLVFPLLDDRKYQFKALQVQLTCYLKMSNVAKALETLNQLNDISSDNLERLFIQYNLAIQANEDELMLSLSHKINARIKNSIWHTPDNALLNARTYLILAGNSKNQASRTSYLAEFLKRLKLIEKEFRLTDYQWHRNLLKARFYLLAGDVRQAEELWQEYLEQPQVTDFYAHFDEQFIRQTIGNIESIVEPEISDSNLHCSQQILLQSTLTTMQRNNRSIKRIIESAEIALEQGDGMAAVQKWFNVWQLKPFNVHNALSLIKSLSLSIPMDIPIEDLTLAYRQAKETVEVRLKQKNAPSWYKSKVNDVENAFMLLETRS